MIIILRQSLAATVQTYHTACICTSVEWDVGDFHVDLHRANDSNSDNVQESPRATNTKQCRGSAEPVDCRRGDDKHAPTSSPSIHTRPDNDFCLFGNSFHYSFHFIGLSFIPRSPTRGSMDSECVCVCVYGFGLHRLRRSSASHTVRVRFFIAVNMTFSALHSNRSVASRCVCQCTCPLYASPQRGALRLTKINKLQIVYGQRHRCHRRTNAVARTPSPHRHRETPYKTDTA